jgi:hypothetical protein
MPQSTTYAQRIQRLSVFLAWACLMAGIALPFAVLAYWLLAGANELALLGHLRADAIHGPLHVWQRLAGAMCTLVPAGLASLGLWHAHRCFRGFIKGEVFTAGAVLRLRRFAACMGGSALAAIIAGPVLSVLLTWGNPAGARQLALGIGSDHLLTLLFAGMVWVMAAVIGQGQALAEENASFV